MIRIFLCALAVLASFPVSALAASDVVARVGGVPITAFELEVKSQKLLPLHSSFHSGVSKETIQEVREKALNELIERNLKVRYALHEEIPVPNEKVEKAFRESRERFSTEEAFREAAGGDLGSYRASIYRALLAKKAENMAVHSRVSVTEEDVRAYYDENKHRFKMPRQFKASHILVKVDPSATAKTKEELKQKARELASRAQQGEDFYNLAYYNSDDRTRYVGGDLGYFHKGQMVSKFEKGVLELEPGEISDPVRTMYGWHIIKLVEDNPSRQMSYETMREKLRQKLEKEQRDAYYEEWMSSLRDKFRVERMDARQ